MFDISTTQVPPRPLASLSADVLVRAAEHRPALRVLAAPDALGDPGLDLRPERLVEGNAERLGTRRGRTLVRRLGPVVAHTLSVSRCARKERAKQEEENSRLGAALLDVVLARLLLAPGDDDDALVVERRHDVLPAVDLAQARVVHVLCALEHVRLDLVEQALDGRRDVRERERALRARVAAGGERLLL